MIQSVKLPPIPPLSITKILALRQKLLDDVFLDMYGVSYTGDEFTSFVHELHTAVPSVPFSVLYQSVRHLAGVTLTDKELDELAWRLTGNLHYMKKGVVVPPWLYQRKNEWCLVQIIGAEKTVMLMSATVGSEVKVPTKCCNFDMIILAGSCSGKRVTKFYRESVLFNSKFKSVFGFSKYNRVRSRNLYGKNTKCYPLKDALEYVKLRFYAYIEQEKCKDGLTIEQIKSTSTIQNANRQLMEKRTRTEFTCPKGYDTMTRPCYLCELGYDKCSVGCHPFTYTLGFCKTCDLPDRYFDQLRNKEVCIDCLNKGKGKS